MDREAWRSAVHGVTKSWTSLKTLAPWKKSYDKPRQCIKKQRYYFTNKDPYNHSCGFSSSHVWMWELSHSEGWALKNWCFWTVVLVCWTARRSNQSILKEINPEDSLEGLMLKLKLQYFGHLMQRTDSLEKTLILGMIEVRRRQGQDGWMASLDSMDMSLNKLREMVKDRETWCAAVHGSQRDRLIRHDWSTEQQLPFSVG